MKSFQLITRQLLSMACLLSLFVIISCGDDDEDTSPGTSNAVVINEDINADLTLENINPEQGQCDYIIDGFLQVNADLIIQPGVCVVFKANSGLYINVDGSIQAVGTASEPITLTGESRTPGFWRGLQVRANDVRNELNHVTVEYAGSDFLATYGTSIKINGGVAIEGASGWNGSLKVFNSTIQNCIGYGLIVEHGTLLRDFANNSFINNTEAAVRIDADNVGAIDGQSTFSNNNFDGIEINASGSPLHDIVNDATWQALSNGAAYRVEQSIDVEATLTIMPGTIIEFEANKTMYFKQDFSGPNDGIIIAKGTASEPITFTGATKTAGYWMGLVVHSNSLLNEMDHCIVEYGGSDQYDSGIANILLTKDGAYAAPYLTVTNSTIQNSAGCGIYVETADSNFVPGDSNTFADNSSGNICQ
ncbi:right-handed parallel beta-helix repeat-containing protein [Mangrovivirga sp. M17]|uniref:Right-handed parallel beta-helix repeat-containing protein n=1 Tax=Mangrovivirga halotolerans TaxID=2993936 RepID=A0ABT3RPQ2_9BACT|nr:right-handed parallel beta-helix repeat-containing protein [Mangrovivirga halotolerans]MCX2743764.1 right-handed parallel beta-helix repeat-containing protein [Mangrovivirga halotolerans]